MALRTSASKQARADEIYLEFRGFFRTQEAKIGLEAALEDMLRFARYHAAFRLGRGCQPALAGPLSRVARLAEVSAILVMRLHDCHSSLGTLSQAQFMEALSLLESYVFRRVVCGAQSRGYWQAFSSIAYRVKADDPLTSLRVELFLQRDSYRFPKDEEFVRELRTRDIYGMRTCHYLLDRFENHGNKEPTDTSSYTIEHIMPQNENLPEAWKKMLGGSWAETHATWLHRLGNLTLTGYNSTYSDRAFEEKKTIDGGFNQSSVRLNQFVRDQGTWTAAEMETRSELLATRALTIWPGLHVTREQVLAAKKEDLRAKASKRDITQTSMSEQARTLFALLRDRLLSLGNDLIEMPETKSVSYHVGDFFLEVLPRKWNLVLRLNLDFDECEDHDDQTGDATTHKFFFHAKHAGGVYYRLDHKGQVGTAMKLVRQAYELARS